MRSETLQRATWAGLSARWEKWDSVILDQLGPVGAAMIERLDIAEDQQHLDIAAGTGEPGLSIARLAPKGRVVLTDLAAEMLDVATRRAEAQGIDNVETKVCSADDLPFDDATFDSVSVRFGYMFFPDMAKATAEFARVLKPGGRLCSSVWVKPEENPWTTIAMQAIATEAVLAPPDPDGPSMFRCAAPGSGQCPVRGRGAARRCRVGRRRRAGDAIARGVLGDDQRPRLARGCGASERRRAGAGADPGTRDRERECLRAGRRGPGAGPGAVHRGYERVVNLRLATERGPGLLGRCVNGFVAGDAVTRSQHDQQSSWFRRVRRHERGVHGVHRDERDITGACSSLRSSRIHCSMVPLRSRITSSWFGCRWKSCPWPGWIFTSSTHNLVPSGTLAGRTTQPSSPQSSSSHSTSSTQMKHIGFSFFETDGLTGCMALIIEDARRVRSVTGEDGDGRRGGPDTDLAVGDVGQAGHVRRDHDALVGERVDRR